MNYSEYIEKSKEIIVNMEKYYYKYITPSFFESVKKRNLTFTCNALMSLVDSIQAFTRNILANINLDKSESIICSSVLFRSLIESMIKLEYIYEALAKVIR